MYISPHTHTSDVCKGFRHTETRSNYRKQVFLPKTNGISGKRQVKTDVKDTYKNV